MENFVVKFNFLVINNTLTEVLIALLSDAGFDGFIEEEGSLSAYIKRADMDEESLKSLISTLPLDDTVNVSVEIQEEKNWNEEWEKNFFKPIKIGNQCLIRSSFHPAGEAAEYEILVDPKMAFGTGHHATTFLMVEELLQIPLHGKQVLDMGCGTGILAILAAKRGAASVVAIDIDEWAFNNTLENIGINNVPEIIVKLGGAELLENAGFDVIIANINRNILVEDMAAYSKVMKENSTLLLSGFYLSDLGIIGQSASKNGLQYMHHKTKNEWTMAVYKKQ